MASPVYNTAAFRRHHGFGGHRRRRWGLAFGRGSMFGGNTPTYLGAGQPTSEDDGELNRVAGGVASPSAHTTGRAVRHPAVHEVRASL